MATKNASTKFNASSAVLTLTQCVDLITTVGHEVTVLVQGDMGSGKTTLTRLLFRLYDPTNGRIQLDDHNLNQISLRDLRQQIGIVTQDVQLFRATVRDNLTFFNDTIPDERILAVLEDLGLWEWVANLSDGLDTELQTEGTSLSAGEAQLLAFTRVFLKDPGLLILDEASSPLDPATEQLGSDRSLHF